MSNHSISRRSVIKALASAPLLLVTACNASPNGRAKSGPYWGYIVDVSKCIGCTACMRACRDENSVPLDYFRTWVERYRISLDNEVQVDTPEGKEFRYRKRDDEVQKAFFVPKLCNHCEKSVCSQVCPVGATYDTADGVVLVDADHCIGCGYCIQACPYGTRFINPETHAADKCTLCYHRITQGLAPACVATCPKDARVFGDLNDPSSTISTMLKQHGHRVLRPEMGTHPKVYYSGIGREVI